MHRLALVELHRPLAVGPLDHPHVLLRRLALVEDAPDVDRLHGADRQRDDDRERRRDGDVAPAEAGRGDQGQGDGEDQEGPLRARERDQDERREHRPGQRADGGDRVQPPGDLSGVGDVRDREPDRPRRAGPEQHHRDGDQDQDPEQRAEEGAGVDLVEGVDREVEERAGDERDGGEQHRGADDDRAEAAHVGPPVGEPAAEPVADRERDEDDGDRVRPDDRRGAEERRQQPRCGDLGAEARHADDEHEQVEKAVAAHRGQPALTTPGSARAGAPPARRRPRARRAPGRARTRARRRARSAPASRCCGWRPGRRAR